MSYINTEQIWDSITNRYARVSTYQTLIVDERTRLVGPTFAETLSTSGTTSDYFWSVSKGTNAIATIATGVATLTSNTTAADWCQLNTIRKARYITSSPNIWRGQIIFNAVSAANTTTYMGPFNGTSGAPQDGFCFAVSGTGVVSLMSFSAGSAVLNINSGFNGTLGTTYSVPDTNNHQWEILYSISRVYFIVDNNLLHTASTTTAPFSPNNMSVQATVSVVNGGSSVTSRVVQVLVSTITRYGKENARPQFAYFSTANAGTVLKYGAGTLHGVVIGNSVNNATVALYDGTSSGGTQITLLTSLVGGGPTSLPQKIDFELDFFTGLYIVTVGTNAATTVIFD